MTVTCKVNAFNASFSIIGKRIPVSLLLNNIFFSKYCLNLLAKSLLDPTYFLSVARGACLCEKCIYGALRAMNYYVFPRDLCPEGPEEDPGLPINPNKLG